MNVSSEACSPLTLPGGTHTGVPEVGVIEGVRLGVAVFVIVGEAVTVGVLVAVAVAVNVGVGVSVEVAV